MMSTSHHIVRGLAILASLLWTADSATAQFGAPAPSSQLQLPASPESWINSPPLSTELLKGKAAVFYLFEEG